MDLLYHETTFIAEDEQQAAKAYHSTTIQAATIARDANVGRLIIGHFSIRYGGEREFEREARSVFPNAEACQEGMTFAVEHLSAEEKSQNMVRVCESSVVPDTTEDTVKIGIVEQDGMKIDMDNGVLIGAAADITIAHVPEGVKAIAPLAFKNCEQLQEVVVPFGVQDIGKSAFQGCKSLQTVVLPDGITVLRESMFKWCCSLKSVRLPDDLETVEKWAFRGCESLESLALPRSLQSVGIAAFQDCRSLQNLELPNGIKYLQLNVFKGCPHLQDIEIPTECLVFEGNRKEKR